MATAKQVYYSPPQNLLTKRKNSPAGRGSGGVGGGGPAITVTIPFTFSSRLSRRQQDNNNSNRRQSAASIRRSRTTLPKLSPHHPPRNNHHHHHHNHHHQHPHSARPSIATTSKSTTTTTSDSAAKRTTAESLCETQSKASSANVGAVADADPLNRFAAGAEEASGEAEVPENVHVFSPEEEEEMKHASAKCLKWLQGLPSKFSGMHIVQQIAHADHR